MSDAIPGQAPRAAEVQFGPWLSEVFERFGAKWGVWFGQGLLVLLLSFLPLLPFLGPVISDYQEFFAMAARNEQPSPEFLEQFAGHILPMYAAAFVSQLLSLFIMIGMLKTAAKQLRGEPIGFADAFSGGGKFLPVLGQGLIVGMAFTAAAIVTFCIVGLGAVALLGLWYLAMPLVVLGNRGPIEALGESWKLCRPQWLYFTLWVFLMYILVQVGQLACGIGMAASIPLFPIAQAIAYRDIVGLAGAVPRAGAEAPPMPTGLE